MPAECFTSILIQKEIAKYQFLVSSSEGKMIITMSTVFFFNCNYRKLMTLESLKKTNLFPCRSGYQMSEMGLSGLE